MFKRIGVLGCALAAFTMAPSVGDAAVYYRYPQPSVYRAYQYRPGYRYGYWRYGHYHPYRYGFYDARGRWHRY